MAQRGDTLKDWLYSDLLQPTAGFETDFAVGMTYSLSFDGLLSVPMSFGLLGELDSTTRQSPAYLLESIRRGSDKFILFCNKGGISVPQNAQTVYSLLESSIQEVCAEKITANFHPKMWVIHEVNTASDEEQIRIIILSRNLTYSEDLDIVVSMRGGMLREGKRNPNKEKNRPIEQLLLKLADQLPAGEKKNRVQQMAEDVLRVAQFDSDDPFAEDGYQFFPIWFGEQLGEENNLVDLLQGDRLLIMSPFVDDTTLSTLASRNVKDAYKVLITRRENISQQILDTFDEVYTVNDTMVENNIAPVNLHAKMYLVHRWHGDETGHYLYLGSANATNSGFHRNTEMMLGLKFQQMRGDRFEQMKAEILGDEHRYVPVYEPTLVEPTEQEKKEQELEHVLKYAMRSLKKAVISEQGKGLYSIILQTTQKDLNAARKELGKELSEYALTIRPLQCPALSAAWNKEMQFVDIPGLHLSEFYVLEVKFDGLYKKMLCKVPTNGMPADRDTWIYQSVVNTREKFMNYVSLMLTDEPMDFLTEASSPMAAASGNGGSTMELHYPQIYEQMLRVAYQNPRQLRDVGELVARMGKDIVPEDFNQMLKNFTAVIKQLERL